MKALKMKIISLRKDKKTILNIAQALKQGKVLVLPTDTVYGLIADARNKKAIERIFKIKKRPPKKPLPVFVASLAMAKKYAFIDKEKETVLKFFWPGEFTFILRRKKGLPSIAFAGKTTIGLRIPDFWLFKRLFKIIDFPLVQTSANLSGQPPPTKINQVLTYFKKQKQKPDIIFTYKHLKQKQPSIVIDCTFKKAKVLRG